MSNLDLDQLIQDLSEKISNINLDDKGINQLIEEVKEKIESNQLYLSISDDVKTTLEMVTDWREGKYTDLSQNTIFIVLAGLCYIVNPLNILPKLFKDSILDEIIVMGYILKKVRDELGEYRKWKENQDWQEDWTEEDDTVYIEIK